MGRSRRSHSGPPSKWPRVPAKPEATPPPLGWWRVVGNGCMTDVTEFAKLGSRKNLATASTGHHQLHPNQNNTNAMTVALISFGSTILAILLVSAIRTEGRLSRLEAKLDVLTAHMLPAPPQEQAGDQQSSPDSKGMTP